MTTPQIDKEKIADKIAKLLRLATSPVAAEAQAALTKAQELSARYGVEMKEGTQENQVIETTLESQNTGLSITERQIALHLSKYFRVKSYLQSYGAGRKVIKVVGLQGDVETFVVVYLYTINIFEKLWKRYWTNYKSNHNLTQPAAAYRNTYLFGFLEGTRQRFEENIVEKGLMVIIPASVVKAYDAIGLKSASASSVMSSGCSKTREQGIQDGKTLQDKTKQVSNGVKQLSNGVI